MRLTRIFRFAVSVHLLRALFAALTLSTSLAPPANAQQPDTDVQTVWRLLDYIAVDYGGAVSHGAVSSPSEYAEQTEFAATVATKVAALPAQPSRSDLLAGVGRLQHAIADKADPARVADMSRGLAAALLTAYPVPLAPNTAPSFDRGTMLFNQNCAACHGAKGDGHGPAAAALATRPIAFIDPDRARQRSVFALYQVITQGLDGTPMASFASLPTADRWALAFYAGHFAFPDSAATEGAKLWRADASLHAVVPDLQTLVGVTPAALEQKIGRDKAIALVAFLRRHPDAVGQRPPGSLALVRDRLARSLAAYRAGDKQHAEELALSAYLDGFEPVEPALGSRDASLLARIEGGMGDYRGAMQQGDAVDAVARRAQVLDELLNGAETALAPSSASNASTFLGAAAILLREGLEALLIVVAMIAFLRKAERLEVMPYVHGGWISALLAGGLTWAIATWVIGITGANRELVEGVGSVFAAVVLLWVGIWMHGKAQADEWQRYIREKMSKALSGRSAWLLFGLAFVVVYREVFETILFYAALWTQGNGGAMLAGAGTACVALSIIAWVILGYSRRLPIAKFFQYSSWLMALLTVVLAGKGFAALQEAGIVGIAPLSVVPRVELVGLFPTVQTVGAQVLMAVVLFVGFRWNQRHAARAS
jgi:high-affinity iron transporter